MATRIRTELPKAVAEIWSRFASGILSRGAVSFLVAYAGVNVSNFIFHIVVSRLLGPAQYGAVGAVLSILSLMSVPVGAAQLAVTQSVMGHSNRGELFSLSRLIWRAFLFGCGAMIAMALLTSTIDRFLDLRSPFPLYLVAAWIPLATVGAMLQGALIGEYRFRVVAFATFVGGGPVRLLAGTALVLAGFGVTGAIVATIFAQAFTTGSLLISARHRMQDDSERSVVRPTSRDVSLSIASIGSYTALIGVDTFLSRHFLSATTAGQYAAGAVAAHIALFVPSALVAVTFPHLVNGNGTSEESRRTFVQALKITTSLGFLTATMLTIFSGLAIRVLFDSKYADATSMVAPLSFASAVIGVISLFVYFHVARRSLIALTPWLGVALASAWISLSHPTITSVATKMLIVSSITLLIIGAPAFRTLALAKLNSSNSKLNLIDLPPAEIDFTLVVPFYNPGSRLGSHVREIVDVLSASGVSYEILAVSDGSTDRSEDQITDILSERLTLVRLEQNQGKGAALRAGLSQGRGEYLGFIDGDGDLPAILLLNLLNVINREHPDIIVGSKWHPESKVIYPPLRRIYSWGYQQLNRILFRVHVSDTQTGIKVIRRDVLSEVLPRMVEKRFAFDLELMVVAQVRGFHDFAEIPVRIGERFTSTISLKAVRNMLVDTLAIYYRLRVIRFYGRAQIQGSNVDDLR